LFIVVGAGVKVVGVIIFAEEEHIGFEAKQTVVVVAVVAAVVLIVSEVAESGRVESGRAESVTAVSERVESVFIGIAEVVLSARADEFGAHSALLC